MRSALAVLLICGVPSIASAQKGTSWSRVTQLDAGSTITLTYLDGRTEDRLVVAVSDVALVLRAATPQGRSEIVRREQIREIVLERRVRARSGTLIGAGAGLAIGTVLSGAATAGCSGTCGDQRLMVRAAWAGIGAALAYRATPVHLHRETIYRIDPQ